MSSPFSVSVCWKTRAVRGYWCEGLPGATGAPGRVLCSSYVVLLVTGARRARAPPTGSAWEESEKRSVCSFRQKKKTGKQRECLFFAVKYVFSLFSWLNVALYFYFFSFHRVCDKSAINVIMRLCWLLSKNILFFFCFNIQLVFIGVKTFSALKWLHTVLNNGLTVPNQP